MEIDFDSRVKHVIDSLESRGLPAVIIKNPSNINYLTGFSGSNGCLLITFQLSLIHI